MDENGILGIGIRVSSKYKEKTVFFFDFLCPCEHKIIVELDFMTIEDFVSDMVQEYTEGIGIDEGIDEEIDEGVISKKKIDRKTSVASKISDSEFGEMIDELNSCEYWEDFLIKLGFSSSSVEQYKQDGVKEFNNRKNGV